MIRYPTGKITVQGSVGFASQEPWILNDTLRSNVTFGLQYDEVGDRLVVQLRLSDFQPILGLVQHRDYGMQHGSRH